MGLQEVSLPPVPPTPQPIVIDGKLDDWQAVTGYNYNPLGQALGSGGNPVIGDLLSHPVSANLKACYDTDALYVSVEWTDHAAGKNTTPAGDAARWQDGGEGFELHLLTDRVLHLACWPSADGKALSIMARYDDQAAWQDVSGQVTAAGAPTPDGKGHAQELKIPWAAITKDGKMPPNGKLEVGADFAWNALPASLLDALRDAAMSSGAARGTSYSFLSSHPPLTPGPLFHSEDWGQLDVSAPAAGDQVVTSANGSTSLAVMPMPAPSAPPTINGDLTSWDQNLFQTIGYLRAFWPDRFTGKVAVQSDADNLYLAAHFSSYGPMTNKESEATQAGFNGGDALQIRLEFGGKHVNLCGWFDTAAGKAALTADAKDIDNPYLLQQGAQEAFTVDPDKRGYTQEIAVPWKLFFPKAPATGDKVKATLQPWFTDLTPLFSIHGRTTLQRQGALSIAYKMPVDGQLTLGLYDKDGKLLKWLVQDEYRYKGDRTQAWDGLDQWGKPLPAGSYALKALYHAPITLDYLMTVCNPGAPPWPTPDDHGDWLADESTPQGVATDGKWIYVVSPCAEKGFSIVALDENGQRQWASGISFNPHCATLAVVGDYLYVLYSGPEQTDNNHFYTGKDAIGRAVLICLDKRTGRQAKFTRGQPQLHVATWPYREEVSFLWDLRNNKSYTPFNYGGQPRYFCNDFGESTDAIAIAGVGGRLYISLCYENKLLALDAETGKPTGDDIPLDSPAGLCALDDHTLLAVSGKQVVKVDLATKTAAPFLTGHLVAPDSIALDKQGNIYVSDWGTSFQVKVFNAAGEFQRAIGKEGGRPWIGTWDPSGMLVPRGIAVTDAGKLWVAEDDATPKRVSVWDAASGALIKDYIGPTPYGGGTFFWMDAKDPTIVHAEGATFKVDYANKTYTPLAIDYRRASLDAPFTPNGHSFASLQVKPLYHDGVEYAMFTVPGSQVTTMSNLVILRHQGDIYQPVAVVGGIGHDVNPAVTPDSDTTKVWDSDLHYHIYKNTAPTFFKGHLDSNFSWYDTNGDGLVQEDEMKWIPSNSWNKAYADGVQNTLSGGWGDDISDDWSIFFCGGCRDKEVIYRLDLKGWSKDGVPMYDIADAKPIITVDSPRGILSLHVTHDKKLIVAYEYEWHRQYEPNSIECYDLDGHPLWSIAMPQRLEGKAVHANCVTYDYVLPGLGDVVCTWLYHGSQKPFFFTTDGLYVGTALDETLLGPTAIWSESSRYYYQGPDGQPYLINGANQQEHIFKLNGLEAASSGRFEDAYQLTDADVQKATAMREVPEEKAVPKPVIGVTWLKQPPAIDGDLADWNLGAGVSLDGGHARTAGIALGRDADNLYLAYKVHEPTPPLVNNGSDWQSLFLSGDCVDLMLQTDPKADPHRRGAAAGDERLLLSVFQGQPIAVLYRPVVPGTTSPQHLASAQIDQIIRLDSAKIAVSRDAAHGTYSIEAAVPLKDLGLDAKQASDLRGDVGVVFGDETGHGRALRLYYYNHNTDIIADLTTEASLQPSEWGPIAMPLGPSLLQNGSFEDPLVDSREDADKGWFVYEARSGCDAVLSTESPYTGHQSLLLEATAPVSFPPEAYSNPDYGAFIKSVNDGKGWGSVQVMQKVPVTAGHLYSLRYHYRCEDFVPERKEPGHPRGYVLFGGRIDWAGATPGHGSAAGTGRTSDSTFDWQTIQDWSHGYDLPHPYVAPEGAVTASVWFGLRNVAEGALPRVFLDDVEFVDVTPGIADAAPAAGSTN